MVFAYSTVTGSVVGLPSESYMVYFTEDDDVSTDTVKLIIGADIFGSFILG